MIKKGRPFIPALSRFYEQVNTPDENGCMKWTGCVNQDGYGKFYELGKFISAHRFSYKTHCGEIPSGLCILHSCDNPWCVAPGHLFIGTNKENTRDCMSKGRFVTGHNSCDSHWKTVLTRENVVHIRKEVSKGESTSDIARELRVSRKCVDNIKHNRTWRRFNGI